MGFPRIIKPWSAVCGWKRRVGTYEKVKPQIEKHLWEGDGQKRNVGFHADYRTFKELPLEVLNRGQISRDASGTSGCGRVSAMWSEKKDRREVANDTKVWEIK